MKEWLENKSLKFKLWAYFVLFASLIMIILWMLQIIFLKTYYQAMKTKEIIKIGNTLITEYGKKDFPDTVYRTSYNNGIMVHIFDSEGNSFMSSSSNWDVRPLRNDPVALARFLQKLSQSENGSVCYTVYDERVGRETLYFGAILENKNTGSVYMLINSPLAPVDSTTAVLKNQLIIVTIISLLLAFALSFFIATRLSNPITKITETADELGKGNYDVVFEKGGYTEIDQLATTLNYATRELSKTEELRKDLIANISHDLRTPLTMVKAYAEMIRDISGNNEEKRNAHTKVIIDEADRLSKLVKDILDLSIIQSGTSELKISEFDLLERTKSILSRFNVLSETDGYTFKLDSDENVMVKGDKSKIEQVIYNLVSNAVNYTGEDKIVGITIKDLKDSVRFEVMDTGDGIPKEELEQIWERYYKSKKQHKRAVVGTGLGLSIVKGILNAHGAEFGVRSTVGKGSTFWFELKK